ncbi:MAG: carboxylesterase family protein [Roseburia sp.]|nr:carboxylesterase family protein [Roseburia sp.]MCM1097984.1 carboxylesterase family protein [Ruminococcus flavefaciens]
MFVRKLTQQIICDYDQAVVSTKQGKLQGVISDNTYIFRGVAYARARRFHMPEPVEPWEGVKEAIAYGHVCLEIKTPVPHDQYNVPHYFYPQSENCQYLNVWTQSLDPAVKRPVMVWLHGGGFSTGSGIEHFAYDGENLSRYGNVVVVTLNHRLNVLGYLDLSDYGKEYRYSGNVGMADIVAALEWVQENIRAFGGDPDNVTIFGQSGGGGKVATLLQMPSAAGLFHRAAIQSGVMKPSREHERGGDEKTAERILNYLGLSPDRVKELEEVPYYRLAEAVENMGSGAMMRFGPTVDGDYYPGSIFQVGVSEHGKKIPVIVGTVLGEFTNNFNFRLDDGKKNQWEEAKRERLIRETLGKDAEGAIAAFRKAYPGRNIADLLFVDTMCRIGSLMYAEQRDEPGCAGTYNYLFNLEFPLYGGTMPWHNAEIPYVFHNADYIEPSYIPGVTEWLQDIMCKAWVSFAEGGVPRAIGMPEWEPFTKGCPATMVFDQELEVMYKRDAELMDALSSVERKLTPIRRGGY